VIGGFFKAFNLHGGTMEIENNEGYQHVISTSLNQMESIIDFVTENGFELSEDNHDHLGRLAVRLNYYLGLR
jgi:hypothetical protein